MERRILTKDQILEIDDLKTEEVWVPEWSGSVSIRSMTARSRDLLEKDASENFDNYRAKVLAECAVNADGSKMFTPADLILLGGKNASPINRLYKVAAKLSGLQPDALEEKIEDLPKTPEGSSSTD